MTFNFNNSRAARLTPAEVLEIRELYSQGWSQSRLCKQFNMSVGQIGRIVRGEAWRAFSRPPTNHEERMDAGLAATVRDAPMTPEIQASMQKLAALMEQPEPERFDYTRKPPSLYSDPPPDVDGEPTGEGLDRLSRFAARQPRVDSGLDELLTDDNTQPKETDDHA